MYTTIGTYYSFWLMGLGMPERLTKYVYTESKLCINLVFLYVIISRCKDNKTCNMFHISTAGVLS